MSDFGAVARPYARAVFDLALAAGQLDAWARGLAAAAAVVGDKAAREFLGRPGLGVAKRSEFVLAVAKAMPGGEVLGTAEGTNLLKLLAENDRLAALPEISAQFDALKAEQENKVKVRLVSAATVDAAEAQKISGALSKKLGRQVELELEVDASLIGGAIVRAEDMVIDDSLRTRLQRLASALTD
jgi:F-type H+-transporting ATPase subunit delta